MLHLRIIAPTDLSDAVIATLSDAPGATHITVRRGDAIEPPGDLIECDLTREAANDVLAQLKELDVVERGSITMEQLDTVLSAAAVAAEKAVPGDPADAVVWEELTTRSREEATLSGAFLCFLTIACMLAAVGVITNSPVTVVGAMVVGPEFGPLAAIAVAITLKRPRLAIRSLIAIVVGFPIAMVVTGLFAWVSQAAGWFTINDVLSAHEVDFIYQVGPFSAVVALLAGAAGMLSMISAKSAALVGVFISVTTVPAAGYAVVAAILGEWVRAGQSLGQLVINLAGIIVAGVLVLTIYRLWQRRHPQHATGHVYRTGDVSSQQRIRRERRHRNSVRWWG